MRFSTIAVGAFAAVAAAQSSTSTPASTTAAAPSSTASMDPAQASSLACLKACPENDVNCKAKCVPVPHPSFDQVEKTNQCVADCDKVKGNGTETDNAKYGKCVDDCIGKNYFTTGAGGAAQTSGSGSGNGASGGSGSGNPSSTGGAGGSSNTSGGAQNTGSPKSGAQSLQIAGSAAAVLGFLAAFALL